MSKLNFNEKKHKMHRLSDLPLLQKLNRYSFMPLIWWTILIIILPYLCALLKVPIVWRVGLLFLLINSGISFHLGLLINRRHLSRWWLWLLPLLFDLAMLPHFAKYNLIFGLIYLIFELFGLMSTRIYR